jgi:hypothetical protein
MPQRGTVVLACWCLSTVISGLPFSASQAPQLTCSSIHCRALEKSDTTHCQATPHPTTLRYQDCHFCRSTRRCINTVSDNTHAAASVFEPIDSRHRPTKRLGRESRMSSVRQGSLGKSLHKQTIIIFYVDAAQRKLSVNRVPSLPLLSTDRNMIHSTLHKSNGNI